MHELVTEVPRRPIVSAVFHGRDVFAPAAAHLGNGVAIEASRTARPDPVRLALPRRAE